MNEEDTVTVGQDLVKIELGGAPEGGKKDAETEKPNEPEPKKAAPPKQAPKAEPKTQAAEQPALGDREERRVC